MPLCKYCKSKEHLIDTCPDILCKLCNTKGHPHWKCEASSTPSVVKQDQEKEKEKEKEKCVVQKKNNIVEISIKEEDIIVPDTINIVKLNMSSIKCKKDIPDSPWGDLIEV